MEGHAFIQAVFRSLCHAKLPALQDIVEGNSSSLPADDRHTAGLLRLVSVVALLGHGIGAWHKVLDKDLAVGVCSDCLIYTFSDNGEGNTGNNSVFGRFDDLGRAIAHLDFQERLNGIAHGRGVSHGILMTAGLMFTVAPDNNTGSRLILCRTDCHRVCRGSGSSDCELIAADAEVHAGDVGSKAEVGENPVGIGQGSSVLAAVPLKLDLLSASGALFHPRQ